MIFPIIINSKLEINHELQPSKLMEILKKINEENNSDWVKLLYFEDFNTNNIQLKIKDLENKNNFIILGFIINEISNKVYQLLSYDLFNINIYINKNGEKLVIIIGLNYDKYSMKVDFIEENKIFYKLNLKIDNDLIKEKNIYEIL